MGIRTRVRLSASEGLTQKCESTIESEWTRVPRRQCREGLSPREEKREDTQRK